MKGLIGHRGLPAGEGMLLRPESGVHTAFMRFPIDALFLDRDLRVLDIVERLRPWRVASRRRARAVLELAAGECARRGVKVGDMLGLQDRKAVEPVARRASLPEQAPQPESSESIIWPTSLGQDRDVARIQPMRVLVISRDRHFRSVTSMLLTHRGCSVTATAKAGRAAELITRDRTDVVVIDAGQSPATTQAVAAVGALAQPVGIVVVDDAPSGVQRPRVLAKWGPFEELFEAIERADGARVPGKATARRRITP
jgi:uncharacterized membrane protein (UPF0127 family)